MIVGLLPSLTIPAQAVTVREYGITAPVNGSIKVSVDNFGFATNFDQYRNGAFTGRNYCTTPDTKWWIDGKGYYFYTVFNSSTGGTAQRMGIADSISYSDVGSTHTTTMTWVRDGITFTNIISYTDGNSYFDRRWEITNNTGAPIADATLYQGGHHQLGGSNVGWGAYLALNDMAYTWMNNTSGMTYLRGTGGTNADNSSHYYAHNVTNTGNSTIQAPQSSSIPNHYNMPDIVSPDLTDSGKSHAGYYLQWDIANNWNIASAAYGRTVAVGDTYYITAQEGIADSGYLMVIGSGDKRAPQGVTVPHTFTLYNIYGSTLTVDLSLSNYSWASWIDGSSTVTVPSGGSRAVTVYVTVPSGAVNGDSDNVTLTGAYSISGVPYTAKDSSNTVADSTVPYISDVIASNTRTNLDVQVSYANMPAGNHSTTLEIFNSAGASTGITASGSIPTGGWINNINVSGLAEGVYTIRATVSGIPYPHNTTTFVLTDAGVLGYVWRDINNDNTFNSFEGVSGIDTTLVPTGGTNESKTSAAGGRVIFDSGITAGGEYTVYPTINMASGNSAYALDSATVAAGGSTYTSNVASGAGDPVFAYLDLNATINGQPAIRFQFQPTVREEVTFYFKLGLAALVDVYTYTGTNKTNSANYVTGGTLDYSYGSVNASVPAMPSVPYRLSTLAGANTSVTYYAPAGYRLASGYGISGTQSLSNLAAYATSGLVYDMEFPLVNMDVRLTGIDGAGTLTASASNTNTACSTVDIYALDWGGQTGQLDFSQVNLSSSRTDYTWSIVNNTAGIIAANGLDASGNITFTNNTGTARVRITSKANTQLYHDMEITMRAGSGSATHDGIYIAYASDPSTPVPSMAIVRGATEDMVVVARDSGTGAIMKLPNSIAALIEGGGGSLLTVTASGSDPYLFSVHGVSSGSTALQADYTPTGGTALTYRTDVLVTGQPLSGATLQITPNPVQLSSSQTERVSYTLHFSNGSTQVLDPAAVTPALSPSGIASVSGDILTYVSDGTATLSATLNVQPNISGSTQVIAATGGAPVTGSGQLMLQESTSTGGFVEVGGTAEYFSYLDVDGDERYSSGDIPLPYGSVNVNYTSANNRFGMAAGSAPNVRISGSTAGLDKLTVHYTEPGSGITYSATTDIVVYPSGYQYDSLQVSPSPVVLTVGETRAFTVSAVFTSGANSVRYTLPDTMYTGSVQSGGTVAQLVSGSQNQVRGVYATAEDVYTATLNEDASRTGSSKILVIPTGAYLAVAPKILWLEKGGTTGTVTYTLLSSSGSVINVPNLTDYIAASIDNTTVANFHGGDITQVDGITVNKTHLNAYLAGRSTVQTVTIYVWDDTHNTQSGIVWHVNPVTVQAGGTGNSSLWLIDAAGNLVTTVDLEDILSAAGGSLAVANSSIATIASNPTGPSLTVTGGAVTADSSTTVTAVSPAGTADLTVNVQTNTVIHGLAVNPQVIEIWPGETKSVTVTETGTATVLDGAQLAALTQNQQNSAENTVSVNSTAKTLDIGQGTVPLGGSVNILTLSDTSGHTVQVYIINHTQDPGTPGYSRTLNIVPELTSVAVGGSTETAAHLMLRNNTGTLVDNIPLPSAVVTWTANTSAASLSGRASMAAATTTGQTVRLTGTTAGAQEYRVTYSAGSTPLNGTGRIFVYAQDPSTNIQSFTIAPNLVMLVGDTEAVTGRITYTNGSIQNIPARELPYAVPNLTTAAAAIATVTNIGLVTGQSAGQTQVDGTLVDTSRTASATVEVRSGWVISGQVTDQATGQAIPGAAVAIAGTAYSDTTDANGNYSITVGSNGTYNLTASASSYSTSQASVVVSGSDKVQNFALFQSTGNITGTVLDGSNSNTPMPGITVVLRDSVNVQVAANITDASGNYSFSGVANGNYTVAAGASGYDPDTQPVTVNSNNVTQDLTLVLSTYTISGTVTDSSGTPVPGVTVELTDGSGTVIATVTTDPSGNYSFPNVSDGSYRVEIHDPNYVSSITPVTVNGANETQNITLTQTPSGSQTVAVSLNPGSIAVGGSSQATAVPSGFSGTNLSYTWTSNTSGVATVGSGGNTVTVTGAGAGSAVITCTVTNLSNASETASGSQTITVTASGSGIYTISGRVTNSSGAAISGAAVTLSGGSGTSTDANGDYSFPGLSNGTYTVGVSATGYSGQSDNVTVNNSNATKNFVLSTSGGTGGGGGGPSTYAVTYSGNGGSGSRTVSGLSSGTRHTVLSAGDAGVARDGYTFQGWNTQAGGNGTSYAAGDSITVTANVTLYAQWKSKTDGGTGLPLNTEDHFAYMSGYPDGTYHPDAGITRGEVAQMLYNLLLNTSHGNSVGFSDVSSGAWYYEAVITLADMGVISGYTDGSFRPAAPITRAEFVTMLSKFTGVDSGNISFSDVSEGHWAYGYIVSAATKGWIGGYANGTFRPGQNITRAEAARVTNVLLGRSADENYVDANPEINIFSDVKTGHWAYYEIMEATVGHDYTKDSAGNETWET